MNEKCTTALVCRSSVKCTHTHKHTVAVQNCVLDVRMSSKTCVCVCVCETARVCMRACGCTNNSTPTHIHTRAHTDKLIKTKH